MVCLSLQFEAGVGWSLPICYPLQQNLSTKPQFLSTSSFTGANMWLTPSVNQLGTTPNILKPLIFSYNHNIRSTRKAKFIQRGCRLSLRIRCSDSTEGPNKGTSSEMIGESSQWLMLQGWNVPWDWKTALYVMMPYLMRRGIHLSPEKVRAIVDWQFLQQLQSILLTGIVESAGLEGNLRPHFEIAQPPQGSIDETAMRLFLDQLLKSVVKLSLLYVFVSPYQPFPEDIFSYRWNQPLNRQNGWLLWSIGGLLVAAGGVLCIEAFMSYPSASQMPNEADPLIRLLPLIGTSNIGTASIIGVLGLLAPLCEETLYRGFLLTTLTKWMPIQVSVVLSSIVFSLAHQSPGKSLEIFIFGVALGIVYAQTRNLLAPIIMHACWNLGVILTLIYSQ